MGGFWLWRAAPPQRTDLSTQTTDEPWTKLTPIMPSRAPPMRQVPLPPPSSTTAHRILILLFRTAVLTFCLCDAFPKLFEPKSKRVARLTAELAALEAERLSKIVVVFGYEVSTLSSSSHRFIASTLLHIFALYNISLIIKISSKFKSVRQAWILHFGVSLNCIARGKYYSIKSKSKKMEKVSFVGSSE